MFERFTKPAREAVVQAQVEARALGHEQITPEHVLLGVLADAEGIGGRVLGDLGIRREAVRNELITLGEADADALRSIGIDLERIREQVEAHFGQGALDRRGRGRRGLFGRRRGGSGGHIPFADPSKRALEQSLRQALSLKHGYIGTEHLLLGLVAADDDAAARLLRRLGVEPEVVRSRVREAVRRSA